MQELDQKAWKILDALQADARISLTELARVVSMSVPAVSERVKRLEEAGVIAGYRAIVPPVRVGYGITAIIGITVLQPRKRALLDLLASMPEVVECHHVTGADSYIIKVITRDMLHLEGWIASVNDYGETRTSIVMSVPIASRAIQRPAPEAPAVLGNDAPQR